MTQNAINSINNEYGLPIFLANELINKEGKREKVMVLKKLNQLI